jgi:uncharacterized membrane protein YqaE (UPF0057 family)
MADREPQSTSLSFACMESKEFLMDGCRIIASIIIPPLGVFLQVGFGWEFWLNILLTLFGYIPGLIHAIWVIARKD